MRRALTIAADELRYWRRSGLALLAVLSLASLTIISILASTSRLASEAETRAEHQAQAHQAFLSQPARHPHRMVHYGHYVFRAPPPLAIVDPGVDEFTGRSIFLEGHRQNSATFAAARETSILTRFGELSPALVLQTLAPLLLIFIGFSTIARERESGMLAQLNIHGISAGTLFAGKGLALGVAAGFALAPLVLAALWLVLADREAGLTASLLVAAFTLYLGVWCLAILFVSGTVQKRASALAVLLAAWTLVAVIVPRLAGEAASTFVRAPGKVETDLAVGAGLRAAGDSHNAGDPAFLQLQSRILDQYGVDSVEELTVNYRGILALEGEQRTTDVLRRFADQRMAGETQQARFARAFSLASPALTVRRASMASVGTDLAGHHRFLKEAEAQRFAFVQALNRIHAEQLSYADDVNRGRDLDAERRTRVRAEHWRMLPEFRFSPAAPVERARSALPAIGMLVAWLAALTLLLRRAAGGMTL